jgi:hypothetical protein
MNYQFCYTTKIGLKGILSTTDIVEPLVIVARICSQEWRVGIVTNVMFVDMREPFQNIDDMITTHFGLFYIENFIVMGSYGKHYCCPRQQFEENIQHLKSNDVYSPRNGFPSLKNEYASKFECLFLQLLRNFMRWCPAGFKNKCCKVSKGTRFQLQIC